jgi:phosphoribosylaminoimidazole-succinocarboxamide synthase
MGIAAWAVAGQSNGGRRRQLARPLNPLASGRGGRFEVGMLTRQELALRLPAEPVTSIETVGSFPKIASGKVREIFDLGDRLLLVASDRISAFDVILPTGVPGKGILLTQISRFWFGLTETLVPGHLLPDQEGTLRGELGLSEDMALRSMVTRKLKPLPIECVARGYLAGSGWSSYRKRGEVCGVRLPAGLREAEQLPEPIFTPTTKASAGHDEPIDDAQGRALVGAGLYERVKRLTLDIYRMGHERAKAAGMILADTKFEFGTDADGTLYLIDEALTPDSSRYWAAETYRVGVSPESYDKQFVRNYLLSLSDWNQQPPGPKLPPEVVAGTLERYLAAYGNLVG